jgi:LmbE family N-acetylglucosaminyl deacetylase
VKARPLLVTLLALAALVAVGAVRLGLPVWRSHQANLRELRRSLPGMAAPTRGERLLILAPHCDDETLACGGLIALAVQAGARVHVVLITNGDGFRFAAQRLYDEIEVPPRDFLRMAAERQQETVAALQELGLGPQDATFLGYPDGGTARMWLSYWDPRHPYTSRQTKQDHNPYPNALSPGAPYCAPTLIEDLKTIIRDFRPTTIFCAHPNDRHSDHWALYCYTVAALYEMNLLDRIPLELYLVHRGDWPVPQGLHLAAPLSPPFALERVGTRWESLPLPPAVERTKHQAILGYHSQLLVMRRFILSFARANELFGQRPQGPLPVVPPGGAKVAGTLASWAGLAPVLRDPVQDLGSEDLVPAGDIAAVYAARGRDRLFLRIDLYRDASSDLRYAVHLLPLSGKVVGPPREYLLTPGRSLPGVDCRAVGRSLEVSVPLPADRAVDGVMLSVDSRFQSHLLDRTAWVLLRVAAR